MSMRTIRHTCWLLGMLVVAYGRSGPAQCEIALQVEVESLVMSNEAVRDHVTGPLLMDTGRFPGLAFPGVCRGQTVMGDFTMHGQLHPVSLTCARSAGVIVASGHPRRSEWEILGDNLLTGPVIHITLSIPDPARRLQA